MKTIERFILRLMLRRRERQMGICFNRNLSLEIDLLLSLIERMEGER